MLEMTRWAAVALSILAVLAGPAVADPRPEICVAVEIDEKEDTSLYEVLYRELRGDPRPTLATWARDKLDRDLPMYHFARTCDAELRVPDAPFRWVVVIRSGGVHWPEAPAMLTMRLDAATPPVLRVLPGRIAVQAFDVPPVRGLSGPKWLEDAVETVLTERAPVGDGSAGPPIYEFFEALPFDTEAEDDEHYVTTSMDSQYLGVAFEGAQPLANFQVTSASAQGPTFTVCDRTHVMGPIVEPATLGACRERADLPDARSRKWDRLFLRRYVR